MSDLIYSWHPSPSFSPGSIGPRPVRFCLHTTEGARDNRSIANFLCGHNGVSYHASVDNVTDRECFEYVYESDGAWAQCNANSTTVCLVFCTPSGASASWSADYWWNEQATMMRNGAKWLADQHQQYGIPLVALNNTQAQSNVNGVCEHQNFGSWGCGHSDCGQLPLQKLLDLAKSYVSGSPPVGGPIEPVPPAKLLYREDYMPAYLELGDDGKCSIVVPSNATHLRLSCSQGGEVNVQWPGKADPTRTYDLNGYKRHDVPMPTGATVDSAQTGQCIVYRKGAEANRPPNVDPDPGPVSVAWILKP